MIRSALVVLALLFSGTVAHAQLLPGGEALSVVITPEYPRPYQTVTVSPRSTLIDLNSSVVRVSVNGANIYEGSGTQPVTFRTEGLGTPSTVVITATDASGRTYTKQSVIRPAEVSLIVEPVSSAHPFYQGGTLVASEGVVRVIALPDLRTSTGARLPASSLVYTWKLGNRVLTDASGIGRSSLRATAPVRYRNADITVTVTSPDSSLVGQARTVISPVDPVARIYRNDPLLGPNFDVALSDRFTMPDTEATFRAVGYFFGVPPTFAWTVNSKASGSDKDITVRSTGSGQGTAAIRVSADAEKAPRAADSRFSVTFGADRGFGFFGL